MAGSVDRMYSSQKIKRCVVAIGWVVDQVGGSIASSNVNECNAQASCVVADVMSEVDQRSQRECDIRGRENAKKCEGWDKNEVGVLKER